MAVGPGRLRLGHDLPVATDHRRIGPQARTRIAVAGSANRTGPAGSSPRSVPGDAHVADRRGDGGGDVSNGALRPLQEGRGGRAFRGDFATVPGRSLTAKVSPFVG